MTIGEIIKQERKRKGLSQQKLAEMLGYRDKSTISKIESSRDVPKDMLIPLSKILDVNPIYLIGKINDGSVKQDESLELLVKINKLTSEDKKAIIRIVDSILK